MDKPLYVVLGALQRVGIVIAHYLAARGARIVLADRGGDELEGAALAPGSAQYATDVGNPIEIRRTLDRATVEYGKVDAVIGCAGAGASASGTASSAFSLDRFVANTVRSASSLAAATSRAPSWPGLRSVVLVLPCPPRRPGMRFSAVEAARAAATALVRVAAIDAEPSAPCFNVVDPGLADARRASGAPQPHEDHLEVARMVEWLVTPAQGWVTGQTFGVDAQRPGDARAPGVKPNRD